MNSRLDAIFRAGFLPAEKTDTWQGLKREEKTGDRKSREQKQKPEQQDIFEDNATLSVTALHNFLLMLLQQAAQQTPPAESPPTVPPPLPETPASHAAHAYQAAARTTRGEGFSFSETPPPVPGPSLALSIEDQRRIFLLIADVEKLAARGVETIPLRKADTFLDSLSRGVAEALSGTLAV